MKPTVSGCVPLPLQFPLQLVEEAPVGALGGDLDHADLMETEGVETYRILGVILPPLLAPAYVSGQWDGFRGSLCASGLYPVYVPCLLHARKDRAPDCGVASPGTLRSLASSTQTADDKGIPPAI